MNTYVVPSSLPVLTSKFIQGDKRWSAKGYMCPCHIVLAGKYKNFQVLCDATGISSCETVFEEFTSDWKDAVSSDVTQLL